MKGSFANVHLILMGPQGSGKGTQAVLIAPRLGLHHLSTGDLFRAAIASGSEMGRYVKGILDRGELVEDDLTIRLVAERLDAIGAGVVPVSVDEHDVSERPAATGALFDGFPRTTAQASGLDDVLRKRAERVEAVVAIAMPREKLITRLAGRRVCSSCGTTYHVTTKPTQLDGRCNTCGGDVIQRPDDQPDAIRRRLALYDHDTEPVLADYRDQGIVVTINGDQPVPDVTDEIMAALEALLERTAGGETVGVESWG